MSRIPSSCFALANLSPFQTGYGSLQVFSVYQKVPKGAENDMKLTGLRRDEYTAQAPGIFKEEMTDAETDADGSDGLDFFAPGRRFPGTRTSASLSLLNHDLTIVVYQICKYRHFTRIGALSILFVRSCCTFLLVQSLIHFL